MQINIPNSQQAYIHQESALQICTKRWIAVKLLAIAINTIDHPRNENP
jgi:hypothetical protein